MHTFSYTIQVSAGSSVWGTFVCTHQSPLKNIWSYSKVLAFAVVLLASALLFF